LVYSARNVFFEKPTKHKFVNKNKKTTCRNLWKGIKFIFVEASYCIPLKWRKEKLKNIV
jgi:hypothetical protein